MYGVGAARQELTMLATVGKQCSQPQGKVHMCRPSTTRTTLQGAVQAVSTGSLENQPRGSVMGADSLVAVYSDPAIHSRSGPRTACRFVCPTLTQSAGRKGGVKGL